MDLKIKTKGRGSTRCWSFQPSSPSRYK